jgi:AAA15 family ATPase/GTPase
MKNFIDQISIQNFKSIRELKLDGLERINLFIGKPNVGKSNILEAFGVFSLPYLKYSSNKNISNFIRMENQTELFFDGNIENSIQISTSKCLCEINYSTKNTKGLDLGSDSIGMAAADQKKFGIYIHQESNETTFNEELKIKTNGIDSIIKSYLFRSGISSKRNGVNFLIPPFGSNLMNVIESIPTLKKEITGLFREYGLKLVFDKASNEIKIMKESKSEEVFLIPYSSIADTLQRIIFYKTAIASNHDSVLIFEEPEAHAFPPYIVHITHEITESKSNQFILSTHSPYILDYFLENSIDELAIFMVDYKNGETVANKLSKEDLSDIREFGIDLFTNYETFLKENNYKANIETLKNL